MINRQYRVHGLGFYSAQSFIGHAILFGVALLFAKFTWDSLEARRAENIQLVQTSVRVDVVAMPKLTIKELKAIDLSQEVEEVVEAQPTKAAEPETKPDQPEFEVEKKTQDFASMLKNLSQKKVVEKANKQPKKAPTNTVDGAKIKKLLAAGNMLSAGSGLVGAQGEAAQGEYAIYLSSMPDAVKPYWKLPSYLASKELQARVRVFIRADGSLIKAELYESSGVEEYDQRALDAVKRARFAALPKGFADRGLAGEIVLGFPL